MRRRHHGSLAFVFVLSACVDTPPPPDWRAAVTAGLDAGPYAPQPHGDGLRAHNPAQRLVATFGRHGASVRGPAGAGEVRVSLRAWGRDGELQVAERVPADEGSCLAGGAADPHGACLRRVDLARPGLTEWWENRPEGLEHGFTVTAPPDGEGPLVFDLAFSGAEVELEGDTALLLRDGDPLRYAGLYAFDEVGRSLPAWMERSPEGLRLVVDDAGAVGTVTVDPLLSTSAWQVEADQDYAELGTSVASAGDVNGDGYGDVVLGAPGYDDGEVDEGRVFLYLGSATGLATTAAWTAASDQAGAAFGVSVASAGDVNGDGYGDVVVGADAYDGGAADEGRAYVYLGSAAGLAATAAWTAEADQAGAGLGRSVACAGDVNGDGYADLAVGAPDHDAAAGDEGRASVYLGSASGLATTPAWTVDGDEPGAGLGGAVASAGDVDGDGYGDLVLGAPAHDAAAHDGGGTDAGRAYVYLGSASGLAASASWTGAAEQAGAAFGTAVASAGDVNGDGYGDVLVGASGYDAAAGDEGRVELYLGSAGGLGSTAAWTTTSDADGAELGTTVAGAGDLNGDGYGDIAVGAPMYTDDTTLGGAAFVWLGSASGLSAAAAWSVESDEPGARFARSVAAAGDLDGDGFGDLLVGASAYDYGSFDEGRVYAYRGSGASLSTTAAWSATSEVRGASFGTAVAGAGDVNGDGYGDVLVGAGELSDGHSLEGAAFLYLGGAAGLDPSHAWTVQGGQGNALLGRSVAFAGDVNGDGSSDVAVGAPQYDNPEQGEGQVQVFHGSASGVAATASWTMETDEAGAAFGVGLASAGDVYGNGYDDLVVGAPTSSNPSASEGRA